MKHHLVYGILVFFTAIAQASECTPVGLLADIAQMRELLVTPTPEHVRKFLSTYTDQVELNRHLAEEKINLDTIVNNLIKNSDKLGLLTATLAEIRSETFDAGPDAQRLSFKPTVGRPVEFVYLQGNWTIKN